MTDRKDSGPLSPTLVTAIDDLELAARLVVEGLRVGAHRSPFRGAGAEFHQYRPYRSGDDLKHLDWKVYARSNRLYTRQYRETTNVAVMLVLDTSGSMDFPVGSENSKWRYAVLIAAALAWLAVDQGNAVGFLAIDNGQIQYLPARSGRVHLRSVLARLDGLKTGGRWDPPRAIGRAAELLHRRGLIMVLSDFYDQETETQRELRHVSQRGHDVAMLQLVAPQERKLGFGEQVELRDAETGEQLLIDSSSAAQYERDFRAFLNRSERFALEEGIDYGLFDCGMPPERTLRDYLLQRNSGGGGGGGSAHSGEAVAQARAGNSSSQKAAKTAGVLSGQAAAG